MKKLLTSIIVIALILTCALTIFAACTGSTDWEHTIVFYSSQGQALQTKTALAIAKFEAKFPGWKVVHTTQGGYDDVKAKVISDLGAGQQPDLAYCYPDHVASYLAQSNSVVSITDLLRSTATVTGQTIAFSSVGEGSWEGTGEIEYQIGYSDNEFDFVSGYFNEGYASNYSGYDAKGFEADDIITMPFSKSTELLYFNSSALKAAGIVDENGNAKPAKTWDELWEHCAILKAAFPDCTPLGYDSEANWFITMCEQNGWGYTSASGDNYRFYTSEARAWLEQLKEYYELGYFTTEEISGAYTSNMFKLGVGGIGEDGNGNVGTQYGSADDVAGVVYCIGSSGGASYQTSDSGKWVADITAIPGSVQEDGSINSACISQGPSLVMLTGGYNVSNAEEKRVMTFMFMKELFDISFQADFSISSGYNPVRESVFELEAYQDHLKGTTSTALAAKVATTLSESFFVSPAFDGSSTARTQVGNALIYVVTGQKDAAKALYDAYINCAGKAPTGDIR